jgi:hypothetical protein
MPSHKVLASIAHNFGHSFTSMMNYRSDDYVLGHLLAAARKTGSNTLRVDILARTAEPEGLLPPPVRSSIADHTADFSRLVTSMKSSLEFIRSAQMTIAFDLAQQRPYLSAARFIESPYTCTTEIIDDRGKTYSSTLRGWWFPELDHE